ncbi:MAG: SDR family NAD(P)-dependent oxidoreductase [Caldilineaceae bacterium]
MAWVTGASSGIGEALVRALAAAGARLVLSARRVDVGTGARTACANADQHLVLPDLLDFDAAAVTQQALAQMGQIDLLIHCGGVRSTGHGNRDRSGSRPAHYGDQLFQHGGADQAVLPSMIRQAGHLVDQQPFGQDPARQGARHMRPEALRCTAFLNRCAQR